MIPLAEINAAADKFQVPAETIDKKQIESYSDLTKQHDTLSVMTLNTIFANKLGLLIDATRNEPRDVFDIWFLLQRINLFDFNFNDVCKTFNNKYGFPPSFSILKPRLHNHFIKSNWNMRLGKQMAELPNIGAVIKDIENNLESLFNTYK